MSETELRWDPVTGEVLEDAAEDTERRARIEALARVVLRARRAQVAAAEDEQRALALLAEVLADGEELHEPGTFAVKKFPPKRAGRRGVDLVALEDHLEHLPPPLWPRVEVVQPPPREVTRVPTVAEVERFAGTLAAAGLDVATFIVDPGWAPAVVEVADLGSP